MMDYAMTAFHAPIHIAKPPVLTNSRCPAFSRRVRKQHLLPTVLQPCLVRIRRTPTSALEADWRSMSALDFEQKLALNALPLCLVGMSNCGKSHWSLQLHHRRGFNLVCVDDKIEHAIKPELSALGYSGIDGLAAWMGFPTDDQFATTQEKYLQLEESITASAPAGPGNTVLDTTGSVCYLSEVTLRRLRNDYLVIHLEASDDMLEIMTDKYFTTPKPVVWGNSFNQLGGETPEEALRRCYPSLLRERRKRYQEIAHLTIPAAKSLSKQLNLEGFITLLTDQLRAGSPTL